MMLIRGSYLVVVVVLVVLVLVLSGVARVQFSEVGAPVAHAPRRRPLMRRRRRPRRPVHHGRLGALGSKVERLLVVGHVAVAHRRRPQELVARHRSAHPLRVDQLQFFYLLIYFILFLINY